MCNIFDLVKENNNEILLLGILTYLFSLIFKIQLIEVLKKLYQIKYPLIYLSLICLNSILFKENLKITYKIILYIFIFFFYF